MADPYRWIAAVLTTLAFVCSPAGRAGVSSADPSIDNPQTEQVLSFGFEAIRDRSLTAVNLGNLAFEGVRGLSTLDPSLTAERDDKHHRISLRYRDQHLVDLPTPADDDANGWANVVVHAARSAGTRSASLHNLGREQLYQAVFDASLSKLDIFSRYAGAVEATEHRAARNGFGGIGIRYDPNPDDIVLTEVMPGTPADEAHLHVGDHITAIDGIGVGGVDQTTISRRLRGPVGSSVSLTVQRPATPSEQVALKRSLIVPPTVAMNVKDGIAVMTITSFNSGTAASARTELKKARAGGGLKGLVLDLRGNPGGLLDQGVAVADLFIAGGRIVSSRGRHPASVKVYDAKPGDIGEDIPLVTLIDGGTASAAEIVAAALQDSGRAVIVGTNSFGKGTVQTIVTLPNRGEMTLTWSRFHTPSDYALHGLGILPTICTSDDHATAQRLLAQVREDHSAVTANLALWRASGTEDMEGRRQLRSVCPASKHTDVPLDMEVARELLEDHALLAYAIDVSETQSASTTVPPHASAKQH
jgi:carboxyl-terminal processing protease